MNRFQNMWIASNVKGQRELEIWMLDPMCQTCSSKDEQYLQGKLLVDSCPFGKVRIWRTNIVDTVVQSDAESGTLFGDRHSQVLDSQYWTLAIAQVAIERLTLDKDGTTGFPGARFFRSIFSDSCSVLVLLSVPALTMPKKSTYHVRRLSKRLPSFACVHIAASTMTDRTV